MTASCVYEGWVRHRRRGAVEHELRMPLFMVYLDLDELPSVFDGMALWSARGGGGGGRPPPPPRPGFAARTTSVIRRSRSGRRFARSWRRAPGGGRRGRFAC
jgi:hypothetical protein